MDSFLTHLGQLIEQYPAWTYVIIGAGMAIQGEITIVLAMYLVAGKILSLGQFFIATFVIVVLYEHVLFFFSKGMRHTRLGWKLYRKHKSKRRIQLYTYFLKKNLVRLIIIAKFVPGMNFLVIALAGWSRVSLRLFTTSYIIAVSLWFAGISAIAYFVVSGLHYLKAAQIFKNAEIGIVVLIVLIFAIEYVIKRFVRVREFEIEKKKHEEILAETEEYEEEREDFWGPRSR